MNLFESFKNLSNSDENKKLKEITDKLPSNDIIAKQILKDIGNDTTKVILDDDIKNSYYVYLKDTIYISNKSKNNNFHRCCLVAHECAHSIQSKLIQKLNFILSNIELVSFVFSIVLGLIFKLNVFALIYLGVSILSAIPRVYLELDAIKKSTIFAYKYAKKNLSTYEANKLNENYTNQIKLKSPMAFVSLFFEKIIRVLIVFFLLYLI